MPEFVNCMTFSELKKMVAAIEKDPNVTDETKVMLDTGWDSLQEILPGSVTVETAQTFKVQDELTKEFLVATSWLKKVRNLMRLETKKQ